VDRAQRLLAWLLGIQLVLLVILHPPFARRGAAASGPLLPALSSLTPQVLEIAGGDGATVTLERRSGGWALGDPAGYPALADKADGLVRSLKGLVPGRQVVSGKRYHASLKVAGDAFERRLRIWEKPGGTPKLELFVGTSPGADFTHVRVGGSDRVYEVAGLSAFDLPSDAGSWVERRLVDFRSDEVGGLEIANHRGSFALEKRSGTWAVRSPAARAKAELDASKVSDLVTALCGLSLEAPAGPVDEKAQGLAAPEATVTIERAPTSADSTSVIHAPRSKVAFRIGAAVPGHADQRYAALEGKSFAVALGRYYADRADTVALGDLLKKK